MNRYQTLGPRIVALILDAIVFIPLFMFYAWLPYSGLPSWVTLSLYPITSLLSLLYTILLHWRFGQTLGKMGARVMVVDAVSEGPITLRQSCLRDIAYIASHVIEIGMLAVLLIAGFTWESEALIAAADLMVWPVLAWLVVDIIVCIKSKKNRALHDFIAGTVVVRLNAQEETEPGRKLEPPGPDQYANALT